MTGTRFFQLIFLNLQAMFLDLKTMFLDWKAMFLELLIHRGILVYVYLFLAAVLVVLGMVLIKEYIEKTPQNFSEAMRYFARYMIAQFVASVGIVTWMVILRAL